MVAFDADDLAAYLMRQGVAIGPGGIACGADTDPDGAAVAWVAVDADAAALAAVIDAYAATETPDEQRESQAVTAIRAYVKAAQGGAMPTAAQTRAAILGVAVLMRRVVRELAA